MKNIPNKIILIASFLLLGNLAFSQKTKSYNYLIGCFKTSLEEFADSQGIDYKNIGLVKPIALRDDSEEEIGFMYFEVPKNKKSLSASKLAEFATQFHIDTWVNNSKVLKNKEKKVGSAVIVDLRLHMRIEDIYQQIITISENGVIYQIMSFADPDDYDTVFDSNLNKVVQQECF